MESCVHCCVLLPVPCLSGLLGYVLVLTGCSLHLLDSAVPSAAFGVFSSCNCGKGMLVTSSALRLSLRAERPAGYMWGVYCGLPGGIWIVPKEHFIAWFPSFFLSSG